VAAGTAAFGSFFVFAGGALFQGFSVQELVQPTLQIEPLGVNVSLRVLAYDALKKAIMGMDIYGAPSEIRLDERRLSADLGVSRTPIREAITLLEQEGFVRSVPRRGIFVVRKTKAEILEMITVWAALESMAARLACVRADAREIAGLRRLFDEFAAESGEGASQYIHDYSQANLAFHGAVMRLGGCALLVDIAENLILHMRAIRAVSVRQERRLETSMREHGAIIEALERRDADLAERLVREHTLGLAAHVERHGVFPG
jgi:DNA-binding GntR family transcriptional regulator